MGRLIPFDGPAPEDLAMRRGFSLLKLLVIIAIIAFLIGLLLPAVQKVREAAKRARSVNNMRQIGNAIANFESNYQKLPTVCDFGPGTPSGHGVQSLHFQILPYVEGDSIYQLFDPTNAARSYAGAGKGAAGQIFRLYISPADFTAVDGTTASVEVLAPGAAKPYSDKFTGKYATTSYPVNGMVFQPGAGFKDMADGTSNTIMIAERYQVCKQGSGDKPAKLTDPDVYTLWGLGAYSASTPAFALPNPDAKEFPTAKPTNRMFVPMAKQAGPDAKGYWADANEREVKYTAGLIPGAPGGFQVAPRGGVVCDARVPQTPHVGGMIVCLVDCSVRAVNGTINPLTFWSAVTPAGGEVLGADW
jgi:type II secretory pathway pseudopilin PulG